MNLCQLTFFAALSLGGLPASSFAQGADGCAPAGGAVPHLSVRGASGTRVLRLENGPAGARAVFLTRMPGVPGAGFARPAALGCLGLARGRMLFTRTLDGVGAFETSLSRETLLLRPTLSAVVLPPGGSLADATLSNAIELGPLDSATPEIRGAGSPPPPGTDEVVITEFMKDPSAVSDSAGEWIELYNPGTSPVDIEGWVLSDLGSDSVALLNAGQGIVVPARGYLVLGRNDDTSANGGVAVDFVLPSTTLSNGDDEIILSLANGQIVDEVHYGDGPVWPDDPGRSASLQISAFDTAANDDPANWCHSSTPLSPGGPDTGTPGLANDACSGG